MDHSKRFHVLVVGGALLGAGCETAPPVADASAASDAPQPDGDALVECGFCPNDCCVPDGAGGSEAREGFVCCWGTSC